MGKMRAEPEVDRIEYWGIGHPGWPGGLMLPTAERAMDWLEEHGKDRPGIYVDQVRTRRTRFADPLDVIPSRGDPA